MNINFFKEDCKTTTNQQLFGIYDSEDNTPARIMITQEEDWNVKVINDRSIQIVFYAIDHCITIICENGQMQSSCDAVLFYGATLLFVELKNKRESWKVDGLSQIKSTIELMQNEASEFFNSFSKKKAIVANRKHKFPHFEKLDLSLREVFYNRYKVRIQFEYIINIE